LSADPAPVPRRWWNTVFGRTAIVAVAAATITACVALLVSFPLLRAEAREQTRGHLANLADVAAATITDPRPGALVGLRALLTGQQIDAFTVVAGRPVPDVLPDDAAAALLAGQPVSATAGVAGQEWLLEGRPVGSGGLVLAAPVEVSGQPLVRSLRRLTAALVMGLLAAIAVAAFAASKVTAPLRRVAEGAEQLAAGERGVQVEPQGPVEVAEIAEAINRLSAALQLSEGRQREFLLSVSHELRTPLTAVAGYAEALADGVVAGDDVPRTGELMVAESRRLDRLVADLLDLSRLGAARLRIESRPTDLCALLAAAAAVWRDRCQREHLRLQLEVPDRVVVVSTDPDRVRQIIDNLAENALRVTPSGGVIVLSLQQQAAGPVIQVRDSGPGLTATDLADAFEPAVLFTRYRGVRPVGSGVGLALVGRLAARLGGSAQASHAPEGGACFTVRLPQQPSTGATPRPTAG
jgi:two-component system sensor histidine kinase BaeS